MIRGVVPATGRSARMGSPKALLDADGPRFIDCVVGALLQGGCDDVCALVDSDAGPVAAAARRAGAFVAVAAATDDAPADPGLPTARIALAQPAAAPISALVILPVDHPQVRAETVARLLAALHASGAAAVAPVVGGQRGHPLVLAATPRMEAGREDPALEVEVDDRGVLLGIDTIADYRRAYPRAWRRRFHSR